MYRIRSIHVSLQNQNHSSQRLTNKTAFKIQLRKAPWVILHRLKMIFPRWHAVSSHTEKLWVTLKWRSLLLKLPLTWYLLCLVTQSCPTLCDPMDCSPPGPSVHGILQARVLEWVAMPSSRGSFQLRDQTQVSQNAGGFFIVWATREAQEYWNG